MPPTLGDKTMNNNETFNYAVACLETLESHAESMMNLYKGMAEKADVVIGGYTSDRYLGMADAYGHMFMYAHEMLQSIKAE